MFVWNDQSVRALLAIARQYQISDIGKGKSDGYFFAILAKGMQKAGYSVTGTQVRRKWKYLRERYLFIKRNHQLFDGKRIWQYMKRMEELMEVEDKTNTVEAMNANSAAPANAESTKQPTTIAVQKQTDGTNTQNASESGDAQKKAGPETNQISANEGQSQQSIAKTSLPSGASDDSDSMGELGLDDDEETLAFTQHIRGLLKAQNIPMGNEVLLKPISKINPSTNNQELTRDKEPQSPAKSDNSEHNVNGTAGANSRMDEDPDDNFEETSEPPRKRTRGKKRPETNTDRIILAMEEEGEKDRAILRQFMAEFSSAAAALTAAIQQISDVSDD